jgi:hypothetical protein
MYSKNVYRLAATSLLVAGVLGGAPGAARAANGDCAQPVSSGESPVASDCLYILRTAVGTVTPAKACVTRPLGGTQTRASDALRCLSYSVGQPVAIDCPCGTPDVQSSDYLFDPATDMPDSAADVRAKFEPTTFLGAFSQDLDAVDGDWTAGWTVKVHGNNKVWEPATEGTLNGATPTADGNCPDGTTPNGTKNMPSPFTGAMDVCDLPDRYAVEGGTLSLTNDNIYRVSGAPSTIIGDGDANDKDSANSVASTLEIEAGTLIVAGDKDAIVISRGSQIQANGTAANPIVMDSEIALDAWIGGNDNGGAPRQWGGLVLTGTGSVNKCADPTYCDQNVEGLTFTVLYGGFESNVNCGSVQYVVLAHTGSFDAGANDLNALTVYGCDTPTTLSYIQSDDGGDDAFEFFGGSAVADHLVAIGTFDDNFDIDYGYRGGVQYMLIQQLDGIDGDKGFEWDNGCTSGVCLDPGAHTNTPRSLPTAANVTIMNAPNSLTSNSGAISFRSHTGGNVWNLIQTNARHQAIRSEATAGSGSATASVARAGTDEISLNNVWMYNPLLTTDSGTTTLVKLRGSDATDVTNLDAIFDANPNNVLDADPLLNTDPMAGAIGYPQQ